MKLASILLFLSCWACSLGCDMPSVTAPTDPPGAVVPPDPPQDDPIQGPPVDMNNLWGFSAFRMSETPEAQQRADLRYAQRRGYTFARICAETVEWSGVLPPGSPLPQRVTADVLLRRTLDIAAEEGMYVLVIPLCTVRDYGSEARREEWVRKVADILRGRDHVFAEAVNEPWHPRSLVSSESLDRYIRILKHAGIRTGADEGFTRNGQWRYSQSALSDFPSAHPFRNPDPTKADLQKMVSMNGGWLLLSETTCWADPNDNAELCTDSKEQIQKYMDNCTQIPGCFMVAHTREGLVGEPLTWLPIVQGTN